ncbi:MAG: TAXI family TRAP transporter solute-binding subunit [Burkholderiaceae bacterium]|nr:TAXI family TRAP transporter solute-binding subunit [Burkholderiaceae bacterium]
MPHHPSKHQPDDLPHNLRYTLLSIRDLAISIGPFVVLAVLLLALAYWWLNPMPPKRVVLATGPAQSAYDEFGKRYAKALSNRRIEVVLLPSEGSSANLQLLREGKADLGFVQGGSDDGSDVTDTAAAQSADTHVESLGSLFVEPIWLFYREDAAKKVNASATLTTLSDLKDLRVNVGTVGSGVPTLVDKLLDINHIDSASIKKSQLEQTPATMAFLNGELDAIVFASAPESLMVQMLLQTPGVKLMSFAQSEAYSRRLPFLSPVVLPRGVVDLAADVPAQDVRLVASTTALLTREQTHPAVVQLFSQTSQSIHGGAGWFNRARDFPNASHSEFDLSKEAERNLKSGAPLLQRYLPFGMANLIERMWLALGIIVAILLPLSRVIPPLYKFRIRSRIFKWYGQLRQIDEQIAQNPESATHLRAELDDLDARVGTISVPLSYADELYALRNNIALVRQKLG